MSLLVHFSPELGDWITENLERGTPAAELCRTMVQERMEARVARAILQAFLDARSAGKPRPQTSIVLEEPPEPYVADPPRLGGGSCIQTSDRSVPVLLRVDSPTLALLGDVLSAAECGELIELARPRLKPVTVVDPVTGKDVVATHRNNLGMFFRPEENPLVARIDRRLSELMGMPLENGEGLQVLHYREGTESTPHFDFLPLTNDANRASVARSGQRKSSLVVYLNDVPEGGETTFSLCGVSVSPRRGNGAYFEYANQRGQVDERTLHAGSPVRRGEKWVATKWMRQRRFVAAGEDTG
jgi:prolyl 4-hydroxylase